MRGQMVTTVYDTKMIIALALVGYEMIIDNSMLHASLAIHHLISSLHSLNNC